MKHIKLISSTIFLVFVLLSIIFYNYYALVENQLNHTGLDLMKAKIFYLGFSLIAFTIAVIIKSNKKAKTIFIISGILGLLFIVNIWILEKTEILLYYEDWVQCCM